MPRRVLSFHIGSSSKAARASWVEFGDESAKRVGGYGVSDVGGWPGKSVEVVANTVDKSVSVGIYCDTLAALVTSSAEECGIGE